MVRFDTDDIESILPISTHIGPQARCLSSNQQFDCIIHDIINVFSPNLKNITSRSYKIEGLREMLHRSANDMSEPIRKDWFIRFRSRISHSRLSHKYIRQPPRRVLDFEFHRRLSSENIPLESQTDRIGFNSTIDSRIIFSSCTFKYANETFRMEYDRRVIIRFLHNEDADADNITQRFHDSLLKMLMHFERSNSWLARYVAVVKTSMMKIAYEDLLLMILMRKFWRNRINLLLNRLARSLRLIISIW
jgi:hypothetical protein